jgi:hypothetical protein
VGKASSEHEGVGRRRNAYSTSYGRGRGVSPSSAAPEIGEHSCLPVRKSLLFSFGP